jgi:hypothetical protein
MFVSIVKNNRMFALRIESGYRTGELVSNDLTDNPQYFQTAARARKFAETTGFAVVDAYDEIDPPQTTNEQYEALLDRASLRIPKGAYIVALGDKQ